MILTYPNTNKEDVFVYDIFSLLTDIDYQKDQFFMDIHRLTNDYHKDDRYRFTQRSKLLLKSIKEWNQYEDAYSGISYILWEPPKKNYSIYRSNGTTNHNHSIMPGELVIRVGLNACTNAGSPQMVANVIAKYATIIPSKQVELRLLSPSSKMFYVEEDYPIYNEFLHIVEDFTERGIGELTDGHYRYMETK